MATCLQVTSEPRPSAHQSQLKKRYHPCRGFMVWLSLAPQTPTPWSESWLKVFITHNCTKYYWRFSVSDNMMTLDWKRNEDSKQGPYLQKKCVLEWSLNISHRWVHSILLCCFQGDETAEVWRPRQVWPGAEKQPKKEEIRRAGSEVGQVWGDLQVHTDKYHKFYIWIWFIIQVMIGCNLGLQLKI